MQLLELKAPLFNFARRGAPFEAMNKAVTEAQSSYAAFMAVASSTDFTQNARLDPLLREPRSDEEETEAHASPISAEGAEEKEEAEEVANPADDPKEDEEEEDNEE